MLIYERGATIWKSFRLFAPVRILTYIYNEMGKMAIVVFYLYSVGINMPVLSTDTRFVTNNTPLGTGRTYRTKSVYIFYTYEKVNCAVNII